MIRLRLLCRSDFIEHARLTLNADRTKAARMVCMSSGVEFVRRRFFISSFRLGGFRGYWSVDTLSQTLYAGRNNGFDKGNRPALRGRILAARARGPTQYA